MENQILTNETPEGAVQNFVSRGIYKDKGVAVFTSGGDAQGMFDSTCKT